MATDKPTKPRARTLSVRRDQAFDDALATLTSTGMTASDAVRLAVTFLAHGYRDLWDSGIYPEGVAPARMALKTPPYDGPKRLTSPYDARTTPSGAACDRSRQEPRARPTFPLAS